MDALENTLSQYGNIEVIKNDLNFTLLITGSQMGLKVSEIVDIVVNHIKDKQYLDVLKSSNDFILLILKS